MKMYIYFDTNGTIKEVINDESIRRGSSDYNKIYCYLEGNPDIDDIWYLQKNPDGTLTNEVSFVDNIVTKAIPYDAKRDMKYFQDFEEYKFYVFTLSSSYLSQNGLVVATIRVAENNTLWALGELTFNVQANIVNSDNGITQSQYDYLLLSYASRTLNEQTGSDLDNLLDEKIEAKISCLGTPDIFDTTANIEALTSNEGIAVATDTGYIWVWNDTDEEYKNTNYKYLADVSIYYTKDEINNYKKMWDNLVYSCEFTIDDSAKTMTISGNWAFTKYSFIVIDNIAVKTISYASLSLGNYCLVIRNNALEFVNFANAIQDGDMVLWIGFLDGTGDIRTDIYRCNNKVTNLALYCSDNIKIDTTNKNFVIPSAYLFWNSGYASISAQNISYSSYLNATCVLVYRNGVFKVLGLQNIELFYNDVIVAVVWFRGDGFPMSKIYVVNEAPDKAITELPLSSKIFMRVGVIGDSYTSGWIKDNDHKNNPNYSWVKHMKQLTGNEWTNFGVSGSSTKSWVDGTLGKLPQVQTKGNKCQAYVIGLMINDQNQGMQTYVPLGTSSDIGTNANSYYAYYYKLINALLSVNSSAIIFCNTCPRTDGDFPSYNQAVIDVVNYCQSESKNVYLVELRNYYWRNETFNNDALNGHYTAIGYEYMAEIFNKAFSDTINANASSLKEVNLIPYDSATVYDYVDQKINDLRWELGSNTLDVESDTNVAFSKSVPSGTIGCQVNKVGGMSYKSENLLNIDDVAETTTNGITYNATNGIYTLNGTATANSSIYKAIPLSLKAGTYILNSFNTSVRTFISIGGTDYNANTSFTLNSDFSGTTYYNIYFTNGTTFNKQEFKPMLVKGSTSPTTFKPYFDGIRDSAVTSVVSRKVGLNSLRLTQIGAVDLGSLDWSYQNYGNSSFFQATLSNTIQTTNVLCDRYESEFVFTSNTNDKSVCTLVGYIRLRDTTYGNNATTFKSAMNGVYLYYELATELSTPKQAVLDYFVKETLTIHTAIQNLTGYGWGINTCYNYIDFENKKFVQKVGRVDLGGLDYERTQWGQNYVFQSILDDMIKTPANNVNLLCPNYSTVRENYLYSNVVDKVISNNTSGARNLKIVDSAYTDVTAFKSAMNGVYLYYELATPIETDISAYLTTDTIDVESLGTLEFTNTYNNDVPSDIDYLIEEVKA